MTTIATIGRCVSCDHPNCPRPAIKEHAPERGCYFWTSPHSRELMKTIPTVPKIQPTKGKKLKTAITLAALLCAVNVPAQLPPTNYFNVVTTGEVYEYCYGGTNSGGCIFSNIQTVSWTSYDPTPTSAGTFAAGVCCSSPILYVRWTQTMIDGVRLWPDQSYLVTNATFFNNVAYLIEIPIYHPPGGTPLHRLIEIIAPTNSWLQFTYPPDGRPNYPWPDWQDWYGPGAPGYASFIEPNINQDGVYSADRWLWRSVSTNENAVATNVVYNVTPYTP